jgi:NhaA family Na+:H+ antiporter
MAFFSFLKTTFINPFAEFIHDSRAIGITLLLCTFISLVLSNWSYSSEWYRNCWMISFNGTNEHLLQIGWLVLPNTVISVINDLFMAVFFFLAGMEIKREMAEGELSTLRQSILPVTAAIGGMIVPAVIYTLLNRGNSFSNGWAIPMATDIAFTLGVASLLGTRIPVALKIFLTALAIIDDLGAIVVIAFFYGGHLQYLFLLISGLILFILWLLQRNKIAFGWYNWILGLLLWYCMFNSGIHATVAGVLFAFMVPSDLLGKLEIKFHHPVYFFIMPVFALANTAILFPANSFSALNTSYSWGILLGLFIGKPLGICGACYIMIRNKYADLPNNTNWYKMIGAGILAAIGFTMSIFISTLSFKNTGEQDIAKIAVLITSMLAMTSGYFWFFAEKSNFKRLKKH